MRSWKFSVLTGELLKANEFSKSEVYEAVELFVKFGFRVRFWDCGTLTALNPNGSRRESGAVS